MAGWITPGVQWNSIPFVGGDRVSPQQQQAVIGNICLEASSMAAQIANTPIRSVLTTEEQSGPNYRLTVQWSSGVGRFIASRWPVTQVTAVQVSPNAFPRSWTPLPAGSFEPEYPVDGLYGAAVPSASAGGQGIIFGQGYLCWPRGWPGAQISGRNQFRASLTYLSGWPHACITTAGTAGATQIAVDDCTGWVLTGTNGGTIGAAGIIYDAMTPGSGQEPFTVTGSSAMTGPGTITLSAPLNYAHGPGVAVSAVPATGIFGTALLAGRIALIRGATATTVQTTGGRKVMASPDFLYELAKKELSNFRRTV